MQVKTKNVTGRRTLRFATLDDVLADIQQWEGTSVKSLGNWSVGQILAHLAIPINGAIDGMKFRPAWYIRWIARCFKKRFLYGRMPAGFKLPKAAESELIPPPTSTEDGIAALRTAIARIQQDGHRVEHPILGKLSRDEWDAVNLRHCEMHMSFIVPE